MNITVYLALIGWPLVAIALCALLRPRKAVITAFIGAWLFLPMASLVLPGLPDWTKMSATSISLFAGLLLFDPGRMISFRPRWFDLPMLVWCLCPFVSSIRNNLGPYDGLAAVLAATVTWGLPYLIGRIYLSDYDALRELAIGFFIGGLIYVPFCMAEIWLSPQLHRMVYGFHPRSFDMVRRFGGWRPTVFMDGGLMVGMWMSMTALVGVWLWVSGTVRSLWGIRMPWLVLALSATALLCKSMGAWVLLLMGLGILAWVYRFRSRIPVMALALVVPLYVASRLTGFWSGEELVQAAEMVSGERASSLQTRLKNEDLLADRAMEQPLFGWGRWGRARVSDDTGRDISIPDGLWIIELGQRGLVGLTSMLVVFLLPLVALMRRIPQRDWTRDFGAGAAALATVMGLYLIDCVANAMVSPIYMVAAGGVTGLLGFRVATPARTATGSSPGPAGYPGPPPEPRTPGTGLPPHP